MQGIESLTTAVVSTALDAASLRQQAIAANIANAGRSDYGAQRVSFEATVTRLAQRLSSSTGASASPSSLASIDLRMHTSQVLGADGTAQPVQLDVEVGALAQNTVHFQALVKGLNKYMSVMASAVSEGKR